jgi:uncharacterized protein (DUF1810 family)
MASIATKVSTAKLSPAIFIAAQNRNASYDRAYREILSGRKASHWIWYIFPQLEREGSSPMAKKYAIPSLAAAQEYLCHPVLGPRLVRITEAVHESRILTALDLMSSDVDVAKLKSSMTLFMHAVGAEEADNVFRGVLEKYYDSEHDKDTADALGLKNEFTPPC